MKPYRSSGRWRREAQPPKRPGSPRRGISNFLLALVAYASFTTGALIDSHMKAAPPAPIVKIYEPGKARFSDAEGPGEIAVTRRQAPVDQAVFGKSCEAMIRSIFDGERAAAITLLSHEDLSSRATSTYRIEHAIGSMPSPITLRCTLDKKTWRISLALVEESPR